MLAGTHFKVLSKGSTKVSDGYELVHSSFYNDFKASGGTVYTLTSNGRLQVVSTSEMVYVVSSKLSTVNAYDPSKLGPLASLLQCSINTSADTNGLGNGILTCYDSDGISVWQTDSTGRLQLGNSVAANGSGVSLVVKAVL